MAATTAPMPTTLPTDRSGKSEDLVALAIA
jgi:hypothetical protein